jgi:predicted ribosomally synthesized peptide with SipW-like signal peptide
MNRKIMFSLVIIVMALALVIGGTFAWFTAVDELENVFTAGTVMIDADEKFVFAETLDPTNVNPGDCFNKQFEIENTGTKFILLRLQLSGEWSFETTVDPAILPVADVDGWIYHNGYWYYDGKIAPSAKVDFGDASFEICFDGPTMDNEFQGEFYTLTISFEAIQASNNASEPVWGVTSTYDPVEPESGTNWEDWGAPLK